MIAALGETEDSFRMAIYEYSVAIRDDTQGLCTPQRLKDCHDELIRHYRALSERLARVEGEERERCAKVCDNLQRERHERADSMNQAPVTASECAAAIRAGK